MNILYSLLPVLLFIVVLIYLDSFKLIDRKRAILIFVAGVLISGVAYFLNNLLTETLDFSHAETIEKIAPIIEELLKYLILIYIIKKGYVGFMSDAAIYGFIIGSGFAFSENIYYYLNITDTNLMLPIVRGFGTAIMHGCTIAFAGVLFIFLRDLKKFNIFFTSFVSIIPGLLIHFLYNMFLLPPVFQAVIILIVFSIATNLIFTISEKNIVNWINNELDEEIQLINLFEEGQLLNTNIGNYINKIKERFDTLILFDMIGLIKLNIELSMQLKINMMLQMNELPIPDDKDLPFKLKEYNRIKKFIGKAAYLALKPIIYKNSKDLWKLNQFIRSV